MGGISTQLNQLFTLPINLDLARTETFPYKVDISNYLASGDSFTSFSAILYELPTGIRVTTAWQGAITLGARNIVTMPIIASVLKLGSKYQMNFTFTANTNKILTFITYITIVA